MTSTTVPEARSSCETLSFVEKLARVRAHYAEMPGLSLSCTEAVRLFGFDQTTCKELLETCVRGGILRPNGGRFLLA